MELPKSGHVLIANGSEGVMIVGCNFFRRRSLEKGRLEGLGKRRLDDDFGLEALQENALGTGYCSGTAFGQAIGQGTHDHALGLNAANDTGTLVARLAAVAAAFRRTFQGNGTHL